MSLKPAESAEQYRTLFDAIASGVAIYSSSDGQRFVVSGMNSAGEQMTDVKLQDIAGREIREAFPGVMQMGLYDVLRRVWVSGAPEILPVVLYDDQRLSGYYENHVYKISATEVAAVYTDVTDRKKAEEKVRCSELRFRTLFESMQEGFVLFDLVDVDSGNPADHRFLEINPAFERLTGLSRDAVLGRRVREVLPHIEEYWIDAYCRVALTGEPAEFENYSQDLDRYFRVRAYSPERGKCAVVFEEVTEQKKAQLELKRREEQLRVVFEASQAGILMVDPDGAITLANNRMAEMLGCGMDELLRSRYPDYLHPDQHDAGTGLMRRLMAGEIDSVATERHYIRKDGSDFWGYLSGRRHQDAQGNFISLVGHITDISELKHSEAAIKESEVRYRTLVNNIPLGVSLIGRDYRIIMINKTQADMFGRPAEWFVGRYCFEEFEKRAESCGHCPGKVCMETKTLSHAYTTGIRDDGSCIDVHILTAPLLGDSGEPYGFIEVVEDITERKRAEEERKKLEQQLLHAQKLESLGVLAGGIAHDFNNILMAIIGNADLALMRINRESPAVENLHRIEKAAARAAELAKQMLAYSGKGKFLVESLDMNRLLEDMLQMLEVSISKKVVLRLHKHRPLPAVEADATQLRQVIMNLVINASEAIGDRSGVVAITTGCMDCDRSYLKGVWLDENLTGGLYVYLEIADSGCGMDKETLAKLFDPFFTTKFTGRGLGMAAVLGIIRGHKGAIKVYSEQGKGTSFKILLPASSRPADQFNNDSLTDEWQGSGMVLLVDDEETVRGVGVEMLKELGFTAITARDGQEALEIFRATPGIAFVILDLTMPHMDGEQCFRELRQLDPGVKVIISSGYNNHEVTQKFAGKGLAGFIQKPYNLSTLMDTIRGL